MAKRKKNDIFNVLSHVRLKLWFFYDLGLYAMKLGLVNTKILSNWVPTHGYRPMPAFNSQGVWDIYIDKLREWGNDKVF